MLSPIIPTQSIANDFGLRRVPSKSIAYTAGTTLDLTDPATGMPPCAIEFVCTTSGNLVARLAFDAAEQTYAVVAGNILPGLFITVKNTSTAAGIFRR